MLGRRKIVSVLLGGVAVAALGYRLPSLASSSSPNPDSDSGQTWSGRVIVVEVDGSRTVVEREAVLTPSTINPAEVPLPAPGSKD
jgi:hypothetical protein